MSIFGSRENDPLLQNDPLSQPSDDAAASNAEDDDSPPPDAEEADSVFSEPARSTPDAPENQRSFVYPMDAVLDGSLTDLRSALSQGWHLAKVRLQRSASPEEPSSPLARRIVFVLRAPSTS